MLHTPLLSVRRVAVRFGLKPITDDEDWTVYWTDTSVLLEGVLSMGVRKYQVSVRACRDAASTVTQPVSRQTHTHIFAENQPLPRHVRDMSEGSPSQKYEPNEESISPRLQLLPAHLVPSRRVRINLLNHFRCKNNHTAWHSYGDLQAYCRTKKKTFIAKPENSCQGKGIFVFKNLKVCWLKHV